MSDENPVTVIKNFQPDPTKFRQQGQGFVDWKFGQVAEYLGYAEAVRYVETMRRWWDFELKYTNCLLNTSYEAFLKSSQALNSKTI